MPTPYPDAAETEMTVRGKRALGLNLYRRMPDKAPQRAVWAY